MVDRFQDELKTLRAGIADLDRRLALVGVQAGSGTVDATTLAAMFADSATVDFVLSAGTGTISAEVQDGSITTDKLANTFATTVAVQAVADDVTALDTAVDARIDLIDETMARARVNSGSQFSQARFHFLSGVGVYASILNDTVGDELEITHRTPAVASIPFHIGAPLVLTDQTSAQAPFGGGAIERVSVLDLSVCDQVRFTCLVTTLSASANSPRLRLRYRSTGYSATIGNYNSIVTTTGAELSLAATGFIDTGWLTLINGAKASTTALTVDQIGGDGAADPAVTSVIAYFR